MDLVVASVAGPAVQVAVPVGPAAVQVAKAEMVVVRAVQAVVVVRAALLEEEPGRSAPDQEGCLSYLVLSHQSARKGRLEPVPLVARVVPVVWMVDVVRAEMLPYSLAHCLEFSALPLAYQLVEEGHWF